VAELFPLSPDEASAVESSVALPVRPEVADPFALPDDPGAETVGREPPRSD
jgi:hypothetical protein